MKVKKFELDVADLPNMADAVFRGTGDGWVAIAANAKGRQCIEQVFPETPMGWGDPGHDDFPEDWQSLELNMPAAANTTGHNLPPIYGDGPLDEATPDAVAFLLAIATQNQGALDAAQGRRQRGHFQRRQDVVTIGSHQATIGRSQVHITPRWILEALGPFNLDPCAAAPRPWDCARVNFTEADDGLSRPWKGRTFLNPPFNRYGVDRWMLRMAEHNHGIALLHVRPETTWFAPCWRHASGMLFLRRRVIFCKPDGSPQTISNPASKHFGKAANSGAPVALISFGAKDLQCLRACGIELHLITAWEQVGHGAERRQAAE